MANTLMSLLVSLGLDASDFEAGIDKAEKKASSLQSGLAAVGGAAITGGIAAAGAGVTALTGFLVSSIGPASTLGESINAASVVFGEGSDIILEYGKTAAKTVGLANSEFNQLATVTGAFLQNVGFDAAGAADETIRLTERAADMASVFNTDVSGALAAIQSGLKGEFNPLEQFGVKLNAAAIESKALEMGLARTSKELTDSMKATAALELIYAQTEKTAGDFANTSDSVANQQRILTSMFEDLRAQVGTALLPLMQTLGSLLTDVFADPTFQTWLAAFISGIASLAQQVITYIPQVLQWFQTAFGWLSQNQGVIVGILAAIGAAIAVFVYSVVIPALVSFIAAAAPVIAVMALIGAAAYILYTAWTENWGGIRDSLQPVIDQLVAWFQETLPVAIQALSDFWTTTLLPALQTVWEWLQSSLFPVIVTWIEWLKVHLPEAIQALVNFWNNTLYPALQTVWNWIKTNLVPLFEAVGGLLGVLLVKNIEALVGIWQNVMMPAIQAALPVIEDVAGWVGDKLAPAFEWVADAISKAVGWIGTLTKKLKNVKLPAWMTPGSPTPWEIGLLGVSDALKQVSKTALPQLEASLAMQAPAGLNAVGGETRETNSSVTFNITGGDPKAIADEIERRLGQRAYMAQVAGARHMGA
jgi:hypothetical protein